MTGPSTVPEVFAAAADYIDEHGWLRGDFCDGQGRVCVRGALFAVVTGNPMPPRRRVDPYRDLIDRATVELDQATDGLIEMWNDAPGRTAQDVTGLLRQLADATADSPASPAGDADPTPVARESAAVPAHRFPGGPGTGPAARYLGMGGA